MNLGFIYACAVIALVERYPATVVGGDTEGGYVGGAGVGADFGEQGGAKAVGAVFFVDYKNRKFAVEHLRQFGGAIIVRAVVFGEGGGIGHARNKAVEFAFKVPFPQAGSCGGGGFLLGAPRFEFYLDTCKAENCAEGIGGGDKDIRMREDFAQINVAVDGVASAWAAPSKFPLGAKHLGEDFVVAAPGWAEFYNCGGDIC